MPVRFSDATQVQNDHTKVLVYERDDLAVVVGVTRPAVQKFRYPVQ